LLLYLFRCGRYNTKVPLWNLSTLKVLEIQRCLRCLCTIKLRAMVDGQDFGTGGREGHRSCLAYPLGAFVYWQVVGPRNSNTIAVYEWICQVNSSNRFVILIVSIRHSFSHRRIQIWLAIIEVIHCVLTGFSF
jgi:hypothetical protein